MCHTDTDMIYTLHFINSCIETSSGIMFGLFNLARLYDSFQDTIYALNNCTVLILLIIVIITDTLMAFSIFVNNLVIYCITVSLLIFYLGLITALFATKLLKLTISIRQSNVMTRSLNINSINNSDSNINSKSSNSNSNSNQLQCNKLSQITKISQISKQSDVSEDYFLNARQINLLQLISKQTLLAFISAFVAVLWIIVDYFVSVSDIKLFRKSESTMGLWLVAGMIGMNMFAIFSTACVWLSFVFSQKDYNVLCNQCHSCTLILFASVAMSSIIRHESMLESGDIDRCTKGGKSGNIYLVLKE